jgi:putative phosphotransacetylase
MTNTTKKVPIETSARHIHLSQKDLENLFGQNYELKVKYMLSQPNQFAAQETLTLINKDKKMENVRITGPARGKTQIELAKTDAIKLNLQPPTKVSGDIKGSLGIIIENLINNKKIKINEGVIIAQRHLHLSEQEAKDFNLKNNQVISIKVSGERALIFNNVIVRAGKEHSLSFQIDTDESNAAGNPSSGEIIG